MFIRSFQQKATQSNTKSTHSAQEKTHQQLIRLRRIVRRSVPTPKYVGNFGIYPLTHHKLSFRTLTHGSLPSCEQKRKERMQDHSANQNKGRFRMTAARGGTTAAALILNNGSCGIQLEPKKLGKTTSTNPITGEIIS
jgi:hypothetical protein